MISRRTPDGLQLFVRVTPRASRDEISGLRRGADEKVSLAVKVRAVPDKGRANEAVIRLLAETLGLAASSLTVVAGLTDRNKTLLIRGDAAKIAAVVETLISGMKS